jgi:hypothetical protein
MFIKDITKFFAPPPILRIGFEDVLIAIKSGQNNTNNTNQINSLIGFQICLINTMDPGSQSVLIPLTMPIANEEAKINEWLDKRVFDIRIIIYGRNAADDTVEKKYRQLKSLGFSNVFVYSGGIFEWCLLQDIYGAKQFPTTTVVKDMLIYKPPCIFNPLVQRLGYL